MECVDALAQLGGIAPYSALIAMTSRRKLRTALAAGTVARVARDRYALPASVRGRQLAIHLDAHLSHESAALEHGWEVCGSPAEPRLIVPSDRALPRGERARIRVYDARRGELHGWATAPVATVLLCARDLDQRSALAIADSALRHKDVTEEELVAAAASWPAHVQWLVAHASGKAANPFESALRSLLLDCGLEMVPQFEVHAGGSVFHPDLVDPIRGLIVEGDSWSWHADKEAHECDCRRYNLLTADGWLVLRFTYDDVMHRPRYVRSVLRAAYELLGHPLPDTPTDTPVRSVSGRRVA